MNKFRKFPGEFNTSRCCVGWDLAFLKLVLVSSVLSVAAKSKASDNIQARQYVCQAQRRKDGNRQGKTAKPIFRWIVPRSRHNGLALIRSHSFVARSTIEAEKKA